MMKIRIPKHPVLNAPKPKRVKNVYPDAIPLTELDEFFTPVTPTRRVAKPLSGDEINQYDKEGE